MWRHQSKDLAQGFVHSAQHPGTSWSLPLVLPESRLIQGRKVGLEAPKATPWYRVGGVHLVHPGRYKDNHGTINVSGKNKLKMAHIYVKVWYNGQQKCESCFAALMQNEFITDVARFTTQVQSYLATCQVRLMQQVESSSSFCTKISKHCGFYQQKPNSFCSKWRNTRVLRDCRVLLSNQKSAFRQLAPAYCCRTSLNMDGKTHNIAIQLVLQQRCKKGRFCCPLYRS